MGGRYQRRQVESELLRHRRVADAVLGAALVARLDGDGGRLGPAAHERYFDVEVLEVDHHAAEELVLLLGTGR
ncbi:MAG: hypothetical protein M5U09_14550 [Gammaproteobacteria bacterium]|nr:hypothetical protein [Gammaproteobacteria bacterium]